MTRARMFGGGVVALLFVAGGCTVGPDYAPPDVALRGNFLEADPSTVEGGAASRPDSGPTSRPAPWWETFGDPLLVAFVEDAARANYDVRETAARVEEVRAMRGVVRSALYPKVDATASAERRRESGNSLFFSEPSSYDNLRVGLEASWEIDFFGRVRRENEAAEADVAAAEETLLDATRVVVGNVVEEYVALRGAERELATTLRNVDAQRGTLELVERLAAAGVGVEADVSRARALLSETQATAPALEARVAQGAHRLSVLLGGDAADVKERLSAATAPTPPRTPDPGVPSDVLRARPDVRAAERELAAATARIGVATADLYPRVSLTGLFGFESTQASSLFESKSFSFGVGPAVRWPLIDYGATRDRISAAGARQAASLARFEHVVARAVTEVESALAAARGRRRALERLTEALTHTREASRLVEERFGVGAASFLDVLDARRRALAVEVEFVRAETALLLDLVALNRALARSA